MSEEQENPSIKQTEKIYPCINMEYNPLENAVYYNDEFNGFFEKYFSEVLPELLMPLKNEVANNLKDMAHQFLLNY